MQLEIQKQMVAELGERADKIRNKMVKPYEDNMLKITNDGRKLALDQRLIDPDLPDDPDSKVNICVGKIFEIWEQAMPQRSAQLVFCDLSTPKGGKALSADVSPQPDMEFGEYCIKNVIMAYSS